jgi:DNA polymerase-1
MLDFVYYGSHNFLGQQILYDKLNSRTSGEVAVDVETVSLEDRTPLGIGFSIGPNDAYYFPTFSPNIPLHILRNPNILKVFHNGHFDLQVIKNTWDIDVRPIADTIIGAQILGYPQALKDLAYDFFQIKIPKITDLIGKKGKKQLTMDQVPIEIVSWKCCLDVQAALLLWREEIKPKVPQAAFDLDMKVLPVIMEMEDRGIRIDEDALAQHIERIEGQVEWYAKQAGFNLGSSKQLAVALTNRGHKIKYNTKTGNPVLNKDTLKMLYPGEPLAHLAMLFKGNRTLLTNTLKPIRDKFLLNGRIHPQFHQNAVATGRLSSSKPNSMNITKSLRNIVIPKEGYILEDWDLSQIELRVLAYMSQDPAMLAIFANPNGDVHSETSDFIFGDHTAQHRRTSKDINFGIVYGGDAWTLYEKSQVPLAMGEAYMQKYFQKFSGVRTWIEQTKADAKRNGYTETLLGRRRSHPNIVSGSQGQIAKAERELVNHCIQGTAAEHLKELMWRLRDENQINVVHDDSLMERELDHTIDIGILQNLAPFATPAKAEVGMNWRDLTEVGVFGF